MHYLLNQRLLEVFIESHFLDLKILDKKFRKM